MNKFSSILFITLLPIITFSQINWSKQYSIGWKHYPQDFVLDDSDNIFIGGVYEGSEGRNIMFVQIDKNTGDLVESHTSCTPSPACNSPEIINCLVDGEDGSIYACGRLKQFYGGSDFVAKLAQSNDLNYEWILSNISNKVHHIDQLLTVSDGVIVLGRFSTNTLVVLKFNESGQEIWNRKIDVSSVTVGSLVKLDNDTIALYYVDDLNNGNPYLSFIDREGNISSTYPLEIYSVDISVTPENKILSIGFSKINNRDKFELVKYSEQGNKQIVIDSITNLVNPSMLCSDSNGNIFMAGASADTGDNSMSKFTVAKYNDKGLLQWRYDTLYQRSAIFLNYMKTSHDEESLLIMGRKLQRDSLNIIIC